MSIKTKFAALALAALAATAGVASTTTSAEAHGFHHGWGWGVGAGLVGAAVIGSAIAADDGYYGYHHCGWVRQYDAFGHYVGRVRSCY
jgi:uncharacterized membrane protein HdeD (DUF308 family)